MLKITKGNVKPVFYQLNIKHSGNYNELNSDEKDSLKKVLIEEQHSRCAYYMCRIGMDNSTLEHYIPRSNDMTLSLDYRNLFAVCDKTRKKPRDMQTCDVHRNNEALHIDPRQQNDIDTIYYTHKGYIHSDNEEYEIDISETLNLNCQMLVDNRARTMKTLAERSNRRQNREWTKEQIKKYLEKLEAPDDDTEYAGYLIYMLKKRLSRA